MTEEAMKLYIKQKVFSFTDRFIVKDEKEEDKYFVEGEMFSMGHKLHIYDISHKEVGYIRQKLFTFMPKFEIIINGIVIGDLIKKFTFINQSYYLDGTDLRLTGDFWAHDYTLYQGEYDVMTMSKEWFTWGDSYVLNISDQIDEILCLAIVLAIDCEMCSASNRGN